MRLSSLRYGAIPTQPMGDLQPAPDMTADDLAREIEGTARTLAKMRDWRAAEDQRRALIGQHPTTRTQREAFLEIRLVYFRQAADALARASDADAAHAAAEIEAA